MAAPMAPWIMSQRWNDLLFLHYALEPEIVRAKVPEVLTLDTYQQRAWVSVVPFSINHMRPPGVPAVPWFSHFAEINVRTYVTYGGKPGVYFFSLDASNLSAVWGARIFYRLPYWQAAMKVKGKGDSANRVCLQAAAWPQAGRIALLLWPGRRATPSRSSQARWSIFSLSAIACTPSAASASIEEKFITCHGICRAAAFEVEQNTMAQPTGLVLPAPRVRRNSLAS